MVTGESTPIHKPASTLEKILVKCTDFDSMNRYQDAGEIGRKLRGLRLNRDEKEELEKQGSLLFDVEYSDQNGCV